MTNTTSRISPLLLWIPILGVCVFIGCYFYAASIYPGGSEANSTTVGFDWQHNYWCNLMSEKAVNGADNPAHLVAVWAMAILAMSLAIFFYTFSILFEENRIWKNSTCIGGITAMLATALLFTPWHDTLTIIGSLFGLVALIGLIRILVKTNWTILKAIGILCILLLFINNVIYYSHWNLVYLPLLQKITFLTVLIWMIMLQLKALKFNNAALEA